MEHLEEKRIGDYLIEIHADSFGDSPREWDNFGKMICFHKRYKLGDTHNYNFNDYNGWDEMKKDIIKREKVGVILPLYLYDHSGITISTSPFNDVFDSSQVGFIYCTKKDMKENWIKLSGQEVSERSEVLLKGEVETYDQFVRGDVYGYVVSKVVTCELEHEHKKELDVCWGYYGMENCMVEAESIVQYYINEELNCVTT